jgi:PTS system galactitol-specific IIA component
VEHVIRPALAVGVLKEPVEFQEMGSPENTIQAEIIFLLAMTDPQAQLSLLQKLVQLFQTEGLLLAVKKAKSPEEIVQIFNSQLT